MVPSYKMWVGMNDWGELAFSAMSRQVFV